MKLNLLLGLAFVIAVVQAEVASTEVSSEPSNTSITNSTLAWDGPVNITEPTPSTKWVAGSLHTINWTVLHNNDTDDGTPGGNSTDGNHGNGNDTDTGGGNHGNDTDTGGGNHGNDTDTGGGNHGNDTDTGGGNHGNDTDTGGGNGNDTDTNSTQTDHLSIQLAVGGNVQAVDLVFPLAHNVSKSNGTAQIMVPQHITGGKNFTLAVGHPDQGVSLVSGIEIENKNDTHDKNGTVNPDQTSPVNSTT